MLEAETATAPRESRRIASLRGEEGYKERSYVARACNKLPLFRSIELY